MPTSLVAKSSKGSKPRKLLEIGAGHIKNTK